MHREALGGLGALASLSMHRAEARQAPQAEARQAPQACEASMRYMPRMYRIRGLCASDPLPVGKGEPVCASRGATANVRTQEAIQVLAVCDAMRRVSLLARRIAETPPSCRPGGCAGVQAMRGPRSAGRVGDAGPSIVAARAVRPSTEIRVRTLTDAAPAQRRRVVSAASRPRSLQRRERSCRASGAALRLRI